MNSLITSNPKEASNLRTYIPEYDITIEENNVAHVQAGDYESFTYQIYNDYFSDELHNLFLSKRLDGSYGAYIYKYKLTQAQIQELLNGIRPDDLGSDMTNLKILDLNNIGITNYNEGIDPCEEYPCSFTWAGLTWLMNAPNSCYQLHFEYEGGNVHIIEIPTACPPEFTDGFDQQGGSTGSTDGGNTNSSSGSFPPPTNGGGGNDTSGTGTYPNNNPNGDNGWPGGGGTNSGSNSDSNNNSTNNNNVICPPPPEDYEGDIECASGITTPVICVDGECEEERLQKECDKINGLLLENLDYKNKLLNLINGIENSTFEKGVAIDIYGNDISIPDGVAGSLGEIPPNPNNKYLSIAHIHDALGNDGNGTYSVPSLGDLANLGYLSVIKNKVKLKDLVYFVFTADGTYYALTVDSSIRFEKFWEYLILIYAPDFASTLSPEKYSKLLNIVDNRFKENENGIYHKYYTNNSGALIDETSTDNDQQLKYFLQFLDEDGGIGISVFETDSQLSNFTRVQLNDVNPTGELIKDDCN